MDTYGDLVTLLLCFFVLLFSMSTVEENRFNAFVEGLNERFGSNLNLTLIPASGSASGSGAGSEDPTGEDTMDPNQTLPADMGQLNEALEKFISENNLQDKVELQQGASGTNFLRLDGSLLFAGDSYVLQPEAKKVLDFLGEALIGLEDQIFRINFNGHTASIAGSSQDDWILSGQRSSTVASYFTKKVGFSPYKVEPAMYGRYYPIADNNNPATMARNRRVDIVIISNDPKTLNQAMLEAAKIYFPDDDTSFFEGNDNQLPAYYLGQINSAQVTDMLGNLTDEERKYLIQYLEEQGRSASTASAAPAVGDASGGAVPGTPNAASGEAVSSAAPENASAAGTASSSPP